MEIYLLAIFYTDLYYFRFFTLLVEILIQLSSNIINANIKWKALNPSQIFQEFVCEFHWFLLKIKTHYTIHILK